jgi:hypothetical protein
MLSAIAGADLRFSASLWTCLVAMTLPREEIRREEIHLT